MTRRTLAALSAAVLLQLMGTAGSIAQEQPRRGGTLTTTVFPEPPMLAGLITSAGPTYVVGPKVLEGLVTYDFDYNLKPSLATAWKVSDDGLTVTFDIRRGVKWHDGKDFTAEDVAYSINTLKQFHPRGRQTFANVTEIEVPETHKAVLKLSKPAPYLMNALAAAESPIVPKHIYDKTNVQANPANNAPIGTGPFKFVSWKKGESIIYERNPDYWDTGKPYLDRVIFRIIPDAAARSVAFETGELLLGGMDPVPLADVERLRAKPNLAVETRGYEYLAVASRLEFNLDNQYLKNLKVRQAIAHAIDKKFIVQNIWFGFGTPGTGPIHKDLKRYYTSDVPMYDYDPKKADKLLDEAGFPKGAGGIRFRLKHDFLPYGDNFRRTAEYIKQALATVGIGVDIRSQDFPSYIKRVYTDRDYDFVNMFANNTPDPVLGVQRFYWSKNFQPGVPFSNGAHYMNPEVDQILEAAQVETNAEKRAALYRDFQKKIDTDLPSIYLNFNAMTTIYNKRVKNHTVSPLGFHDSFAEVYLTEK